MNMIAYMEIKKLVRKQVEKDLKRELTELEIKIFNLTYKHTLFKK